MKTKASKGQTAPLGPELRDQLQVLASMDDVEIDLTDMPEVRDWSTARRGPPVLHRPVKEVVTIRLDADILHWFREHKAGGRGYQTRINAALRDHMERQRTEPTE